MSDKVMQDIEIRKALKGLDQLGRVRLVGCLADLQPIMKRMSEEDSELVRKGLNNLEPEEQAIALRIWLSDFLERNRFSDIISLK